MKTKAFIIALSGLMISSCGKKVQPADPNADVDLSTLAPPKAKDSTDVNLSQLAKEKGAEPEAKISTKKDLVVGMFVCKKTNDKYVFNEDGTGYFFTNGSNSEIKWSRKDDMVTVEFEAFGKEYLLFDQKKKTLKENSESLGVLVYDKI